MDVIEVSSGTQGSWEIDLLDRNGAPVAFTDGDVPSGTIWAGDDTIDLGDPICEWIDSATGRVQLTIGSDISQALEPARYLIRLTIIVASGGAVIEGWRGWLDIKFSPGMGTALTTYCSYQDMLLYAPQIQRLQLETDRAGFVEARALARRWMEQGLQNAWRGNRMISYTSPKTASYYIYINRDVWLQSQLDLDLLQVDTRVTEINVKRSIAYVYDSALGGDEKVNAEYRKVGNKYFREANQLMKCSVFGLTTADDLGSLDKYPAIIIDCSKRDLRF